RPDAAGRYDALPSCRDQIRDGHVLDLAERQLEEALAQCPERRRVAGRQEAIRPFTRLVVLDPLARERLGHLARGLLGREDQRDAAAEDALEDRADQRVVRATEYDRVDPRVLERLRILAYRLGRLDRERVVALDQGHEPGARDGHELSPRVERVHELRVAARVDR